MDTIFEKFSQCMDKGEFLVVLSLLGSIIHATITNVRWRNGNKLLPIEWEGAHTLMFIKTV